MFGASNGILTVGLFLSELLIECESASDVARPPNFGVWGVFWPGGVILEGSLWLFEKGLLCTEVFCGVVLLRFFEKGFWDWVMEFAAKLFEFDSGLFWFKGWGFCGGAKVLEMLPF